MEYYSAVSKEKKSYNLLLSVMLSEVSGEEQTQKNLSHMWDIKKLCRGITKVHRADKRVFSKKPAKEAS